MDASIAADTRAVRLYSPSAANDFPSELRPRGAPFTARPARWRRTTTAPRAGSAPVCPLIGALLDVADHPPSAFGVVRVVSERGTDRHSSGGSQKQVGGQRARVEEPTKGGEGHFRGLRQL